MLSRATPSGSAHQFRCREPLVERPKQEFQRLSARPPHFDIRMNGRVHTQKKCFLKRATRSWAWLRERLIKMNADVVERLERAIALGLEPPQIVTQNGCVSLAR